MSVVVDAGDDLASMCSIGCVFDLSMTKQPDAGPDLRAQCDGSCPCDQVLNNSYLVDPIGGDDSRATGSGTAGGAGASTCAFKTLTAAIAAIGVPTVSTTVTIRGPVTISAGEQFPITIPSRVSIVGTSSGVPPQPDVTIMAPPSSAVFNLARASVSISSLVIDGGGVASAAAINMVSGTATIADLTITRMAVSAIWLNGGTLDVPHGLVVTKTVPSSNTGQSAVFLIGTASANVSGTVQSPTIISDNSSAAFIVTQSASLTIHGVPNGRSGDGTVVVKNNLYSLFINQDPVPTPPPVVIDGLVSFGAKSEAGIDIAAGSNVKVRNSVLLANLYSGIGINTWHQYMGSGTYDDVSLLDLGRPGDPGKNVLQDISSGNPNSGGGICINVNQLASSDGGVAQTLLAEGNLFAEGDCSSGALTLTSATGGSGPIGCSGTVDIEVGYLNKLDVAGCSCAACQ